MLRMNSAPAGIRTRVTDSKGQYTWPDYTTGAPLLKAQAEYKLSRINLTILKTVLVGQLGRFALFWGKQKPCYLFQ